MANEEEQGLSKEINERLKYMSRQLEYTHIADYVQLLNKPKRLIFLNLIGGIAKGVGIAIGVTIFTAVIIYVLRALGALNLPIIGDFIADIVKIVEVEMQTF